MYCSQISYAFFSLKRSRETNIPKSPLTLAVFDKNDGHVPAPTNSNLYHHRSIMMTCDPARIRNYLWRRKLVFETTFGVNALERWEKLVFCAHLSFYLLTLPLVHHRRVKQSWCCPSWSFSYLEAYATYSLLNCLHYNDAHRITSGGMTQMTASYDIGSRLRRLRICSLFFSFPGLEDVSALLSLRV